MKIAFLLLLTLLTSRALAQSNEKIDAIKTVIEHIDKGNSYQTMIVRDEKFHQRVTKKGTDLLGYFFNNNIVKVIEWAGVPGCAFITKYYLQNNELVYVQVQGKEFDASDSLAVFNEKKHRIMMDNKYYFEKGVLINSVIDGTTKCAGPIENPQKVFAENLTKYKAQFKKSK